jgi:hypothetical protein
MEYTSNELNDLIRWLWERKAGYPNLKKFEGGANWPADRPVLPSERARIIGECCRQRRVEIERANNAAYHGAIDGDFDYWA